MVKDRDENESPRVFKGRKGELNPFVRNGFDQGAGGKRNRL